MKIFNSKFRNTNLGLTLLMSSLLLISLVPGGPIENRDFSHIDPLILTIFNVFLTVLGMGSLFLIPLVVKNYKIGGRLSVLSAVGFVAVYLLDLFEFFPKTPSPMPSLLLTIEVLGTLVAIPQFFLGRKLCKQHQHREDNSENNFSQEPVKRLSPLGILLVVLVGNGIVVFATYSAIYSH